MRSASQGATLQPIPYDPFDIGPLPEVTEFFGESVWELWFAFVEVTK